MKSNLIIFSLILTMSAAKATQCTPKETLNFSNKTNKVIHCQKIQKLAKSKKDTYYFLVRDENEPIEGRGIGVQIFKDDKKSNKPIFEEYGLGQITEAFYLDGKQADFVIKDLNNDGNIEFGIKVLNERTSLLFIYSFNPTSQKVKNLEFHQIVEGKPEVLDRLVGTIDFPIKLIGKKIEMYYTDKKHYTYVLRNGAYHKEQ